MLQADDNARANEIVLLQKASDEHRATIEALKQMNEQANNSIVTLQATVADLQGQCQHITSLYVACSLHAGFTKDSLIGDVKGDLKSLQSSSDHHIAILAAVCVPYDRFAFAEHVSGERTS
jgi:hypothetical protein